MLNKYQSEPGTLPISEKVLFQRYPSLLDDVKRSYYELMQGYLDEDSVSLEFEKLIRKEYIVERYLLDNIASALVEFPDMVPQEKDALQIYQSVETAVKDHWSSQVPDKE